MKAYAKPTENVSRSLDKQPRASKQATTTKILQAYREKQATVQRESLTVEEELLQGMNVNDNVRLETEKDIMGKEAFNNHSTLLKIDNRIPNKIIQGVFRRINTVQANNALVQFINDTVEGANIANCRQVVNQIVNGEGIHTVVNGTTLLHASAGNAAATATVFFRYVTQNRVLILATGHHLDNHRYRLDYTHPGFNGNAGDNFIDLDFE